MSRPVRTPSRVQSLREHPWGSAILELAFVGLLLLIVGLALGLALVGRHGGGAIQGWDDTVWRWSVHHRGHLIGIDKVIATVGDAPVWGPICVVLTAVLFAIWRTPRALTPLVAFLGAEALVYLIRIVMHRHRPPSANYGGVGARDALPGVHERSYSFPSGHAVSVTAVVFALLGLVALTHEIWWPWLLALLISAFVADSRLLLGVHWFSDVTIGGVLGLCWGITVARVCSRLAWPGRGAEDAAGGARHRTGVGSDNGAAEAR